MPRRKTAQLVDLSTHLPKQGSVRKVTSADATDPPSQSNLLRCQFLQQMAWIGRRRTRQLLISNETPVGHSEIQTMETAAALGEDACTELMNLFADCTFSELLPTPKRSHPKLPKAPRVRHPEEATQAEDAQALPKSSAPPKPAKAKKVLQLSESEWSLVFKLRCRSKRGELLSSDEHKLIERAHIESPDRYGSMDMDVFKETAPFGAFS